MRMFVVLLLMGLVLLPESEAWRNKRRRYGRVHLSDWTERKILRKLGKRDVEDLDKNKHGNIDQSETEELLTRGDAQELLSHADENGDSTMSVEELMRNIHALRAMDLISLRSVSDGPGGGGYGGDGHGYGHGGGGHGGGPQGGQHGGGRHGGGGQKSGGHGGGAQAHGAQGGQGRYG